MLVASLYNYMAKLVVGSGVYIPLCCVSSTLFCKSLLVQFETMATETERILMAFEMIDAEQQ